MSEELKPFKREDRYIVIKRKDLAALADKGELRPASLDGLMDLCADLPAREYVVIESDWPEYPIVWQMIKARMNGSAQLPSQGGEPVAWAICKEPGRVDWLSATYANKRAAEEHVASYKNDLTFYITPLYTHPADQVADGVVVSRELLERAIQVLRQPGGGKNHAQRVDKRKAQEELRALLEVKP